MWVPPHHFRSGRHSVRAHLIAYSVQCPSCRCQTQDFFSSSERKPPYIIHWETNLNCSPLQPQILFSWSCCSSTVLHSRSSTRLPVKCKTKRLLNSNRIYNNCQLSSETLTSSNPPHPCLVLQDASQVKKPEQTEQSADRHVAVDPKWLPSFSFSLFQSYILYIFTSLCFLLSPLPSLFLSEEVTVQRGVMKAASSSSSPLLVWPQSGTGAAAAPTRCSLVADKKLF